MALDQYLNISIHALLAESDTAYRWQNQRQNQFLSTLSLRRATRLFSHAIIILVLFLSTLSLRRATNSNSIFLWTHGNFYPRSPCGERPLIFSCYYNTRIISIHALLAESDCALLYRSGSAGISIHALLAESDFGILPDGTKKLVFLSTLSLRRATAERRFPYLDNLISIHALLAESDEHDDSR